MRIATTRAGEPLEELAARVYKFEGEASATALRSAEQDAPRCQPVSPQALGSAGGDARRGAGARARR